LTDHIKLSNFKPKLYTDLHIKANMELGRNRGCSCFTIVWSVAELSRHDELGFQVCARGQQSITLRLIISDPKQLLWA
jgi:hypothetical protein